MIELLILDFDGIVLESVQAKTEAFRKLFSFSPAHVEEMVQFHRENGGMSRYDKIRYFYKNILKEELTESRMEELSARFEELVYDEVIRSPFVGGARELIGNISEKIPLYVVSATPEEELKKIVRERNLKSYFSGVFGSPGAKKDHILRILEKEGVDPERTVFIGDAKNDWEAAKASGVRFIGRVYGDVPDMLSNLPDVEYIINDLNDLRYYLEKVMIA
ncbi:MAG: HAD family hydrolase [Methanomicrobiaceae archaeon]|nr:HAD family hydrolase [Methanomicrobiaceae archaeon]